MAMQQSGTALQQSGTHKFKRDEITRNVGIYLPHLAWNATTTTKKNPDAAVSTPVPPPRRSRVHTKKVSPRRTISAWTCSKLEVPSSI